MTSTVQIAPNEAGYRKKGALESWFVLANQAVIVTMMSIMVALVFTNVVTRYLFNNSIIWAEELSQYLMVWIAFLGAGLALREGRHVAVEMLQDKLPQRFRRNVRGVVAILMAAMFLTVAILGFRFAHFAMEQETPVMNISLAIPYLCVPIGALLLLGHLLFIWRGYVDGYIEMPESLESAVEEGD